MTGKIPFPAMLRQSASSIPDHEILLSFNGDEDAERFSDWLHESGWTAFTAWVERAES